MNSKKYREHRACGGGVEFAGPAADGRPRFRCTKCGESWTAGLDGREWAPLVPKESRRLREEEGF